MLAGDNGIIKKATEAVEKMSLATAIEKVQLEVLGSYGDAQGINLDELSDNLRKNIENLTYLGESISEDDSNRITELPAIVEVDGYEIEIEQDGTVQQVTGEVAAIGEVTYESLQAAFDAVPTDNTQTTVRLLRNTEEYVTVDENKNIILDLNGKILLNGTGELEEDKEGNIYNVGVIEVKNGMIKSDASSTIKNGPGGIASLTENLKLIVVNTELNGTVENRGDATMIIDGAYLYNELINTVVNTAGGEMTIRGDTVIESDSTLGTAVGNVGTMTIEGGRIYSSYSNAIWNLEGATMTIKGGIMETGDLGEKMPTIANDGEILIEGGEFIAKKSSTLYNRNEAIVEKGIFRSQDEGINNQEGANMELKENVIVNAITVAFNNYGTATITGGEYISETRNAIVNRNNAIITIGGNIEVTGKGENYSTFYNYGKATINGGTIQQTFSGSAIYNKEGEITITDGIFICEDGTNITNYAVANISGGTYKNDDAVAFSNYGTATVTGGIFTSNTNAINNRANATLTLGGDTIVEGYTKNYPALYNRGKLTINGGTITHTTGGNSVYNNSEDGGTVTITGGVQTPAYTGT